MILEDHLDKLKGLLKKYAVHEKELDDRTKRARPYDIPIDSNYEIPLQQQTCELEKYFEEKINDVKEIIQSLKAMIKERQKMSKELYKEIDMDLEMAKMQLFELPDGDFNLDKWPSKDTWEKEILKLEEDKRAEVVARWRDVVNLKRELMMYKRELNELQRKVRLIHSGEQPGG